MNKARLLASGVVALLLSASAVQAARPARNKPASDAPPASSKPDLFKNLKFRNLGPTAAGGRVTAVAGVPDDPNVYYVGAAGGGVWKTTDAGVTWEAIFTKEATSSIGAIALAPSNPNLVWVGTGEGNPRNDVTDGRGIYLSTDAGQSWKPMGLQDAGQISRIVVDPQNPDDVFVAAIGHVWAPNATRGVFHSTDGGRTWSKVLFVDDATGCADLVMQPGNPKVLFAAMWQVRRYPWELVDGGPGSGIYRSTDGGQSWKKLTEDLPEGPYGRIALAIAPSNNRHVYALIEAKTGLLWDSEDLGDHWKAVSDNHELDVRPFYFSKMVVSPADEKRIYFCSFQLVESDDGGKTAHSLDKGVHPDHHDLWIDPRNPKRMIQGNDGGVYVTTDAAKSWSFLNNLPIEQFYMVALDSSVPYGLCGGLQDNSAWCGTSNSVSRAGANPGDWWVVTGGDGEYAVPAPSDPNVVYADSQNGEIVRFDRKTRLSRFSRPYLRGVEDTVPSKLEYRFNWTAPIAVSPTDPEVVYLGANVVFKSTDGGAHWISLSGDLTRNDKSKQVLTGGPIQHDLSGAETYDTILSITIAPTDPQVIWVGTDDGLVQVTRDGGKTWTNVTRAIPRAPEWARVYQIGVSPFDAGTAYAAFDAHMLDDRRAYVYKTTDFGKTWTSIAAGLPADVPVHVVREDPNQKGFLTAGTDTGLFFSRDGGATWRSLKGDFPTAPVWDLKYARDTRDLVVATHGRGLFILDDIRPLEQLEPAVSGADFHLFAPGPGTLFHEWNRTGFHSAGHTTPNPPTGVAIDYLLKSEIKASPEQKKAGESPVKITITDAEGAPVATVYGPSEAGLNRFVWKMRYDGPHKLDFEKPGAGESDFFNPHQGPRVLPGAYHARIEAAGKSAETAIEVRKDPRLDIDPAALRAQLAAALSLRNQVNAVNDALNRIDAMQKQLESFRKWVEEQDRDHPGTKMRDQALLDQGQALGKKLGQIKDGVYNSEVQHDVIEDDIHHLQLLHDRLQSFQFMLTFAYGQPPTAAAHEEIAVLGGEVGEFLSKFNSLLASDVAAYNRAACSAGAPTLLAGEPVAVAPPPAI
jgi:photosystem II stability/assembly factor-like uncharacterized protein